MEIAIATLPSASLILFGVMGLMLVAISLRVLFRRKSASPKGDGAQKDLEGLLADISRGLRTLASPARAGGLFYREKQEEVGRLLSELQSRLRLLDEALRPRYEARAGQVLADAARAGITLPPLESHLITGMLQR